MSIPSFGDPSVGAPPTTAQQTYQYEAPEIQARKLGLMDIAGRLAQGETPAYGGMQIPTQQLAAFDPQQQQAFDLASQGIGGYQPYMQQAQQYAQKAADPTSYQDFMNPYQQEVIGGIESQFQKLQNQAPQRQGRLERLAERDRESRPLNWEDNRRKRWDRHRQPITSRRNRRRRMSTDRRRRHRRHLRHSNKDSPDRTSIL